MKVGQMLALYGEHFFPKEVAQALKSLQEDSPPLAWEAIEPIFRQRLGPEVLGKLDIQTEALAAASMGQVHLATIKATGEIVCIKVQYPGVSQAIDNDIKTLRSILSMMKIIPKNNKGFEDMLKEIGLMLRYEVDYSRELKATNLMAELLAKDHRYIVPKTYPEFSGNKVLTTSYEPGVNLDSPEVLQLNEQQRAQIGYAFAKLFLDELFVFHQVQTDPHFGNYKVRINEKGESEIILLDFGALRRFSKTFVKLYRKLLQGAFHNERSLVIDAALKLGFLREDDSEKLKDCFMDITQLVIEPWLDVHDPRVNLSLLDGNDYYRWGHSDLPSRITKKATEYALTFKMRPPPREVIFLDRKIGGVFIVLKTLDARFDGWNLIKPYLQ